MGIRKNAGRKLGHVPVTVLPCMLLFSLVLRSICHNHGEYGVMFISPIRILLDSLCRFSTAAISFSSALRCVELCIPTGGTVCSSVRLNVMPCASVRKRISVYSLNDSEKCLRTLSRTGMRLKMAIREKLDTLSEQHRVRILLAVESGSRAWGFPSADSDYDVRFIYARAQEDYLSVRPLRDVIETPLVQDEVLSVPMDMNGWDVRKALSLSAKSNAVLIEWLASPVKYKAEDTAVSDLLAFARGSADLAALEYHYDRLARNAWEQVTADGSVKIKLYCYALRPALALQWLRLHKQASPMDVPSLCDGLVLKPELQEAIQHLIKIKAAAKESDATPRNPVLDDFITSVLYTIAARPADAPDDRAGLWEDADGLFRKIIAGLYV